MSNITPSGKWDNNVKPSSNPGVARPKSAVKRSKTAVRAVQAVASSGQGNMSRSSIQQGTYSSSFNTVSVNGGHVTTDETAWFIEAVAIAIGNISPIRGKAVETMSYVLTTRTGLSARSAIALASEFAGVETEETCHAVSVLAQGGWSGSLADLLNAARNA